MNSSSPANSSISTTTTVVVGGGGGGGGGGSNAALLSDDIYLSSDLMSTQDCKHETLLLLKDDLMADLNKVVKSLDEDSWMFEGPISRINLISRKGGFLKKQMEITKIKNPGLPK